MPAWAATRRLAGRCARLSDIVGEIDIIWIAFDADDRRRRTAFDSEQARTE